MRMSVRLARERQRVAPPLDGEAQLHFLRLCIENENNLTALHVGVQSRQKCNRADLRVLLRYFECRSAGMQSRKNRNWNLPGDPTTGPQGESSTARRAAIWPLKRSSKGGCAPGCPLKRASKGDQAPGHGRVGRGREAQPTSRARERSRGAARVRPRGRNRAGTRLQSRRARRTSTGT